MTRLHSLSGPGSIKVTETKPKVWVARCRFRDHDGVTRHVRAHEWVRASENLALVGPAGTGKSLLLVALALAAVENGRRVRYLTAANLVEALYRGMADNSVAASSTPLTDPMPLVRDGWRWLAVNGQDVLMTAVPLDRDPDGEVARLVALARDSHEQVDLTEDGETVAVVMTAEEYEGLLETLDILRNPGELAEIETGRAELARGEGIDGNTALAPFLSRPTE